MKLSHRTEDGLVGYSLSIYIILLTSRTEGGLEGRSLSLYFILLYILEFEHLAL